MVCGIQMLRWQRRIAGVHLESTNTRKEGRGRPGGMSLGGDIQMGIGWSVFVAKMRGHEDYE